MAEKKPDNAKVTPAHQPMEHMTRLKTRRWINLGLVLVIIIFAIIGSLLVAEHRNESATKAATMPLVYYDATKGLVTLADSSGNAKANTKVPVQSPVAYETVSPDNYTL